MKKKIFLGIFISLLLLSTAFAHQPRIPEGNSVEVEDPEISKAYYSELEGQNQTYKIASDSSFNLYVNILVPDIEGQKKDLKVEIIKDGDTENPIKILNGNNFEWEKFFEPFGHDTYWKGPEYEEKVEAGEYEIIVSSKENDSKYSLAIGKIEQFDFKEIRNALKIIPQLKKDFFNKSKIAFILSPFGWGLIVIMFILSFIFGFIYRIILRKISKNKNRKLKKNIDKKGRIIRLALGIALFILTIMTSWNPVMLFISGFMIFEGLFSWCGLYAAIGKNTCPIN